MGRRRDPAGARLDDEPPVPPGPLLDRAAVVGDRAGVGREALQQRPAREIDRERNCYEVEGRDANGFKVEAYIDPVSGAIVPDESD